MWDDPGAASCLESYQALPFWDSVSQGSGDVDDLRSVLHWL